MRIAIGADHGGIDLKEEIIKHLKNNKVDVIDCGIYKIESVDYPDYAESVAKQILSCNAELGIAICGTGIGISIAANKIKGIRCALCTDPYMSRMARMHNNANMLALGGRVVACGLAEEIVDVFINTSFESGGRHENRVKKIMKLEK